MFEGRFGTILVVLTGVFLVSSFIVHYFYQRKADKFADEIFSNTPAEYNKQIKAKAYRYLISRGIWGVLFSSSIYNIWNVELKFAYFKMFLFLIGLGLIVWGVWGYKSALKKIKELK